MRLSKHQAEKLLMLIGSYVEDENEVTRTRVMGRDADVEAEDAAYSHHELIDYIDSLTITPVRVDPRAQKQAAIDQLGRVMPQVVEAQRRELEDMG